MAKETQLTKRNNKEDIFNAYTAAMQKIQKLKASRSDNRAEVVDKRNSEILEDVSAQSPEDIVKGLADLRLNVNSVISNIEEKIVGGKTKLDNLTTALNVRNQEIKDIHAIEVNADSLASLVEANRSKEVEFDEEIRLKKLAWQKEKTEFEAERKAESSRVENERKRMTEEFEYQTSMKNDRQDDGFKLRQDAVDRRLKLNIVECDLKLKSREDELVNKEKEFQQLRLKVDSIPALIEKAKVEAAADAKAHAEKSSGFAARALQGKLETANQISKSELDILKQRVSSLTEENGHLRTQLDEANKKFIEVTRDAIKGAQAHITYQQPLQQQATGTVGK